MREERRKAIVLVSFGAFEMEGRAYLTELARRVEEAFSEYTVYQALTSAFILKKLKLVGEKAQSFAEILEYLQKDGFQEVVVQPTHLSAGSEYRDKIAAQARQYQSIFPRLALGTPAIVPQENGEAVLAALQEQIGALEEDEEAVFMGHGSVDHHNPLYEELQAYADRHASNLTIGVLEMVDWPNFSHVLQRLRKKGRIKVYLMPLLFAAGHHVLRDMCGAPDSWENRLRAAGFAVRVYKKGLGVNPLFQEIYLEKIRKLINMSASEGVCIPHQTDR